MSVKRYIAEFDTQISNAYKADLTYTATGSNMGASDVLDIFHIYSQASASSHEYARDLFQFPVTDISTDRTNGDIPASGSVSFFLNLYNAEHSFSVPRQFTLAISPVTKYWDEGIGLDTDNYNDSGYCNWEKASSGSTGITAWSTKGGDFYSGLYFVGTTLPNYTAYFDKGYEDLSVDVTSLVEEWIVGSSANYGIIVMLTSSIESAVSSSYVKKFFARGSEYYYKRPCIEARWDSSIKDRRGDFYNSSSMIPATDSANTLYLYNYFRGQLKNIPPIAGGKIYVRMYNNASSGSALGIPCAALDTSPITGGCVSTGIYSASISLNTTCSVVYDRWYGAGLTTCYHTGSEIVVRFNQSSDYNPNPKYTISMPDLKDSYNNEEYPRLRVFVREKGWQPNVYTVVTTDPETQIIEDLYYQLKRVKDDYTVINFGTGSLNHTRLSYDVSGSYFDFDMSLLESDYMYQWEFCKKKTDTTYEMMKEKFKFRVEE